MSGEGKVVCVTGASGFIASWLVKHLLHRGYTVHATVRSLKDPNKVAHLLALDGAKERMHLFEADLLDENSFDPAINGCEGVFHTASPVSFSPSATKVELVDPAVKGTLNVLGSCVRTPSVKRVVVTSSTAAVMYKSNPISPTDVIDETWFSDKEFAEETKELGIEQGRVQSHYDSQSAIFLAKNQVYHARIKNVDVGFHKVRELVASGEILWQKIHTRKDFMTSSPLLNCYVDVRDVANAHIEAFEMPSASGRYCLVGEPMHSSQLLKIVGQVYPSLAIPEKYKEDLPIFKVSQEKAKSLGINFTSIEVSLKDTVESLKEKNFLRF
nr:cinnamoyl-CoA reductase 1-like [Ipomoea batatas]